MLGDPKEYFLPVARGTKEVNSITELDSILKANATDNGLSSIKLMANQIQKLGGLLLSIHKIDKTEAEAVFDYFSASVFVLVKRKDKVAQAVSRIMAKNKDLSPF